MRSADSKARNMLCGVFLLGSMLVPTSLQAQAFTKADSGWVRIFNGQNFDGLYSRLYGQDIKSPPDTRFTIENQGTDTATIRVSNSSPQGHIGTIKNTYSHYRVRVEYKFDVDNDGFNAGLTYHGDESVRRMNDSWPRSIECQMMQKESGFAYSIQQVTFDTKIKNGHWDPTGTEVRACENGCAGRRAIASNPIIKGGAHWNRMEVIVRGADSAIHRVNDTTVFKLWNIRIYNDLVNKTPDGPHGSGNVAVQSEGAAIRYRRWEIMEFPKQTPENFLNRLFLSDTSSKRLQAGSTYQIKWRHIGAFKKVYIQYNTGTGGWKPVADSVENSDTYTWTVPNEPTATLRLRLTGPAYVAADSSRGNMEIAVGIRGAIPQADERFFRFADQRISLAGMPSGAVLDIQDVSGKTVRSLALDGRETAWDLKDGKGDRVRPGLYFVHPRGWNGARGLRAWVF